MATTARARLASVLLIPLSVLVTAAALELGLRAMRWPRPDRSDFEQYVCRFDPLRGWVGTPGLVAYGSQGDYASRLLWHTNSRGYNDPEVPLRKPPGVRRILVLGDSFAYGFNVSFGESFPRVLERSLGAGYQVVSLGLPGYSTDQELLELQGEGFAYQPDLVLVALFMDDVFNNGSIAIHGGTYPKPCFDLEGTALRLRNVPVPDLRSRSRLVHFLKLRSYQLRAARRIPRESRELDWVSVFHSGTLASSWEVTYALLERMNALCRERGVGFAVAVIPLAAELTDPTLRGPQERLREFGRRTAIPVFDLIPVLAGQREKMYYDDDLHWTAAGHRVAADAMLSSLRGSGFLREAPPRQPPVEDLLPVAQQRYRLHPVRRKPVSLHRPLPPAAWEDSAA